MVFHKSEVGFHDNQENGSTTSHESNLKDW
jgi:hypothetical protein